MKHIQSLFNNQPPKKKKIVNPRQEQIQAVCDFMDDQRYSYWNGRLRKLSPDNIYLLLKSAKEGKNPRALFNYLLRGILESLK